MAVNSRNLLLFLLLSGAAFLTWVLSRVVVEPTPVNVDPGPSSSGYYLVGAVMHGTDDDGRIYYRIHADRVEQLPDGENFVLEGMRVEYTPESDIRWDISAVRGMADSNRESLRLQQEVRLVHSPAVGQDALIVTTTDLDVYPEDFIARTDRMVTMHKGQSEITATGLELNLKTDFLELSSDVSIRTAP